MQDTIALKKHKITLADYDYRHDIENRLVLAKFSSNDFAVLEEILYSSLSISLKKTGCKRLPQRDKDPADLEKIEQNRAPHNSGRSDLCGQRDAQIF